MLTQTNVGVYDWLRVSVLHTLLSSRLSISFVGVGGGSAGCVPFGGVVDENDMIVTDVQNDVIWLDGPGKHRNDHAHEMEAHGSGEKSCK